MNIKQNPRIHAAIRFPFFNRRIKGEAAGMLTQNSKSDATCLPLNTIYLNFFRRKYTYRAKIPAKTGVIYAATVIQTATVK